MKNFLRKFHAYSAMFFLPMAILFALTGVLYICGIREDFMAKKQEFIIKLDQRPQDLQKYVLDFLKQNELKIPSNTELRKFRGDMQVMGSASYVVMIKILDNGLNLQTMERSVIGEMILLHKAKVGQVFVVFSVIFSIFLLLSYFSGIVILAKKHQKMGVVFFILGLVVTFITAAVSL